MMDHLEMYERVDTKLEDVESNGGLQELTNVEPNNNEDLDIIEMESVDQVKTVENNEKNISVEESLSCSYRQSYLYFQKFFGVEGKRPPKMTRPLEMCISSLLAFTGILMINITDHFYLLDTFQTGGDRDLGVQLLTGAYAATSVLLYEAYQSPLGQPRNVFGSYTICSFVGVSTRLACDAIGIPRYVTGPLAVAFGIFFMNVTKTVHPPGGACALIAVIGGKTIEALGYAYMLTSMGAAFIMLAVAVMGNNLFPTRQYPQYWN